MVWKDTMMYETRNGNFSCTFNSRLLERDSWLYFNEPRQIFIYLYQHFNLRFPRHFIFANFQCLRCGECCNHERAVYKEDIERWIMDLRFDILEHVDCFDKNDWCINQINLEPCDDCDHTIKEIVTIHWSGRCPFVRKVRNKPYYKCRIHDTTPEECFGYLCKKSLSVAHINWNDVEDLIQKIGMERFESTIKRERR